jgi:MFS family permease
MVSPVLDSLIEPFGTSAADIGLIISFWTAPGVVVIPVAGVLADRYGRKPVLVASLVAFGFGGTGIAFTTDFRVVLALRFLQGTGYGGLVPVITTSIGDMYDGSREVTGQGLRLTVNGASGTVFPLLAGVLVVVAWQYPFLVRGTDRDRPRHVH